MASKERLIEMLRESTRLEERTVLFQLERSLVELKELNLDPAIELKIREKLDYMRSETIDHNESLKQLLFKVQESDLDEF